MKEMTEARFNLLVKLKTYQLQRSKILKKKHNEEIGEGGKSKEEILEYIKKIPSLSIREALIKRGISVPENFEVTQSGENSKNQPADKCVTCDMPVDEGTKHKIEA